MDKKIMSSIVVILFVAIVFGYFSIQTQIRTLREQVVQRDHQIQTLQNEVISLNEQATGKDNEIASLQQQFSDLNQSYMELLEKYENLLFHYNLLNQPASNFTTYADLNIQFSLDYTTYYYQDPVSGNITINYLNGTAFKGRVGINFYLYGVGAKDFWVDIEGFVRFNLSPPVFQYGPGIYKVTIWSLVTPDGYSISIPEASRPWLQVEAK